MWSSEQLLAIKKISKWLKDPNRKPVFKLFGFAGTGKTTLARHVADMVEGNVIFGAFTGKAALVMRQSGCEGARTIHSLIYKTFTNKATGKPVFTLNVSSEAHNADLIIIDECSMVDDRIARDLLFFKKPILVLGDPGQLPPIHGEGFFTSGEPDIMLTEIHRQARDNPIIRLATQIRGKSMPDFGSFGQSVVTDSLDPDAAMRASQVICGLNKTRHHFNSVMRKTLGYSTILPSIGEKLICLNNDKDLGIYNGGMFIVDQISRQGDFCYLTMSSEDELRDPVLAKVSNHYFDQSLEEPDWKRLKGTQAFDFAYAITAHKSQGSQWEDVLIFDESKIFRNDRWRWLYTAVTRATDRITLVRS